MSNWHTSQARFNAVAAGRRSYKSEFAKRKLVLGTKYHSGALSSVGNYFYAAPTYSQAKRIAWKDLKVMTLPFQSREPSETELIIYLVNGSTINLIGMDKPERIEGSMWHGGVMDEYANMREAAWTEHVQPVTADTNAWIDFIGVPDGRNHFYELYCNAQVVKDWCAHTWSSVDVLSTSVIDAARAVLDERTFRQEYEASFELLNSLAYYAFDSTNVTDEYTYNNAAETYMCWDFNAGEKPMATALVQRVGNDNFAVVKEFVNTYTNTESQCKAIAEWLRENNFVGTLHVTGDYAGKRRESNASWSDYELIEGQFKNYRGYQVRTRPTLSVRDRVAATNALLCNTKGVRRLHIHSSCTALIKDLQQVQWKDSGVQLDGSNAALTHVSDALSYFAYNYFPIDNKPRSYAGGEG